MSSCMLNMLGQIANHCSIIDIIFLAHCLLNVYMKRITILYSQCTSTVELEENMLLNIEVSCTLYYLSFKTLDFSVGNFQERYYIERLNCLSYLAHSWFGICINPFEFLYWTGFEMTLNFGDLVVTDRTKVFKRLD